MNVAIDCGERGYPRVVHPPNPVIPGWGDLKVMDTTRQSADFSATTAAEGCARCELGITGRTDRALAFG